MMGQANHLRSFRYAPILVLALLASLTGPALAAPHPAPAVQGGSVSGSMGDPADMYLEYTISGGNLTLVEGETNAYEGVWTGGPIRVSGKAVVNRTGGTISYCSMGASVGDQSVEWPPEGEDGAVRDRIHSFPFDLAFTPAPDYSLSSITGGAYVRACGGVCGTYRVHFYIVVPTPEPTEEVVETATAAPTATPERIVTIRGTISALDPASAQSWQPTASSLIVPVIEAPVILARNGRLLGRTISQPPDGSFEFQVPVTDSLTISATLQHGVTTPPMFEVVHDQSNPAVWIATRPFDLDDRTPDPLLKPINLSAPELLDSGPARVPPERLDDVGLIYYYAREAWQMAAILLGQPLDFPTLKIRAFSTAPDAQATGYWDGPGTIGGSPVPSIHLGPNYSDFSANASGDNVMHEFGHHLQADAYDNLMPMASGDTNHGGFANPTSSDSWTEGFASFYALWTKKEQIQSRLPQLWHNMGTAYNLELNYLAWSSGEEYAVASLLWDLVDPVSSADSTEMPVTDWASQPVVASSGTSTSYGDYVELDRSELWSLLADATRSAADYAPDAPAGYGYIFDVKQLYDTLQLNGIGLALPATPNGLDALDELFIAHGFFADTNPQNLAWDPGEEIGVTNNQPITVDGQAFPARAIRRSPPPVADSYIGYQVRDATTGEGVDVVDFLVTVTFDPPYEAYDYVYRTRAWSPGQLPYAGPPPTYRATTTIAAAGPRVESSAPLQFTNEDYWQMRAERPTGPLMDHSFDVQVAEDPTLDEGASGAVEDVLGSLVPTSVGNALLPALCVGGLVGVIALGAVVTVGLRSRKRRRAASPSARPAASPAPLPVAAQSGTRGATGCGHCGEPIAPGSAFCGACGRPMGSDATLVHGRGVAQPASEGADGWQLVVVSGAEAGQRYDLGASTTLGRSQDNAISLADERSSRHHAVLFRLRDSYAVRDLDSTNGTLVNGQRIDQTVPLAPGDRLQIGETVLQLIGAARPAAPPEPEVCRQCGLLSGAGASFCGHCGAHLET